MKVLTSVSELRARAGRAIAVGDAEGTALALAGGGGLGVVGVLAPAGRALVRVGDPQVRGASVEVNDERLLVGADGDGTGPLLLLLVGQGLGLTLLEEVLGNVATLEDLGALVEGSKTAVLLEVDQVLTVLAVKKAAG